MILQQIIQSSQKEIINKDIENLQFIVTGGVQSTLDSFMGFRAYKSSDFPEVVCDKNYFFIYGTDHVDLVKGEIKWGKADNIDGSDFVEIGTIISGWQSETPYLVRIPSEECGDSEVLHLYYHSNGEPILTINQETRLWTSVGGQELHNMSWTDKGMPLGVLTGETHTGYLKVYKIAISNYIGIHLTKGGTPPVVSFSTSTNGRDWIRGVAYDLTQGVFPDFWNKPQHGHFFDKYGQKWFIGTAEPAGGSPDTLSVDKTLILAKSNSDFQITEWVKILNNGVFGRLFEATIEGDVAHIYLQNPVNGVYYATYNLNNLVSYL